MKATEVQSHLQSLASLTVAITAAKFFKTGPGQYGEGDQFIGIRVPVLRKLAREFRELPLPEVEILLQSPIHEERLLALLILGSVAAKAGAADNKRVYDLYLRNIAQVNNWDLVDTSAPALIGGNLVDKSREPLIEFARSKSLWKRRIAIISTLYFIRRNDFQDTLRISQMLLDDPEDLIHKATGWMLREVGKRHEPTLEAFLEGRARIMPRTMLRYAIERLSAEKKRAFLSQRYERL